MLPTVDLLSQHAKYFRDQRNLTTHHVGIPLLLMSLAVLLSRPQFVLKNWHFTPGWLLLLPLSAWYLSRSLTLGTVVSLFLAGVLLMAEQIALSTTGVWLCSGLSLLGLGWLIHRLGLYYEGRALSLAQDARALLVGPLFIAAEALFALGWNPQLLQSIEKRVGPTYLRDLAHSRGHSI